MLCHPIIVTADDRRRLDDWLNSQFARVVIDSTHVKELQTELNRAQVVPSDEVPKDVVTMNSTVMLRDLDTSETEVYTLVYPDRADIVNHRLSVLSPVGTAILGYRVGDEFRWPVPAGWRRLKVEKVIYQPEREGEPIQFTTSTNSLSDLTQESSSDSSTQQSPRA